MAEQVTGSRGGSPLPRCRSGGSRVSRSFEVRRRGRWTDGRTDGVFRLLTAGATRGLMATARVARFSASAQKSYRLVVVGGGSGGCATAAKFCRSLGRGQVAVIEPNDVHYYQAMWTMVGGGVKKLQQSARSMGSVLPRTCDWIKDKAVTFDPKACTVTTSNGDLIKYDYLVIAMGLQLNYNQVKGLPEAFEVDPMLCSNYWDHTVTQTFPAIKSLESGNAIFTFPNTPIKCAGAPQKIMYLAEDYLRKNNRRANVNVIYNTSLGVIFGVKKYAQKLLEIVKERDIQVNYHHNLIEVRPERKEAVFVKLASQDGETETFKYSFMHITPPMSAPDVLRESPLVDRIGYLDVNKYTLQHNVYPNIFGIGDCTNVPTSKTAAAVASQSGVLRKNLSAVMSGTSLESAYDGYTSCPLVTGYGKCILAEFDFDGNPMETFPIDQGKERMSMYHLKKTVMPELYWKFLIRGLWEGPSTYRKIMRLGMGRILKQHAHSN